MPETNRYRLGNQPEEYELSEKYLGWVPEGLGSWQKFYRKHFSQGATRLPNAVTLVSPDGKEKVNFNLHQRLMKDAFPLSFFGEERAGGWWNFLKVSETGTPETKFIIPTH